MPAKKTDTTSELKKVLSHYIGGDASDWKRTSKKTVIWQDVDRKFKNDKLGGLEALVSEHSDGLLSILRFDNEELYTARLSAKGKFNAAVKPSACDVVLSQVFNDKELDAALVKQAISEGLAARFSFMIRPPYEDGDQAFAAIYPTVRDATFKCEELICAILPEADNVDECMETEYRFDGLKTPSQIAGHLAKKGLVWDKDGQKQLEKNIYREIDVTIKKLGMVTIFPKPR